MGQAKKRGTLNERALQTLLDAKKHLPDNIQCDSCSTSLADIIPSDIGKKLFGLQHFGYALCKKCDKITLCLGDTDRNKILELNTFLKEEGMFPLLHIINEEIRDKAAILGYKIDKD